MIKLGKILFGSLVVYNTIIVTSFAYLALTGGL